MNATTSQTKQKSVASASVSSELNNLGVTTMGVSSALIGCWAVACLTSGIISSGGPLNLVSNFVKAFVG